MTNTELPSPMMFKKKNHSQKKGGGSNYLTQSSFLKLKNKTSLDSLDFR